MRRTVLVVTLVLLSGCITPRLAHRNLTEVPGSKALVYFSTGAEYRSLAFHTALSVIEAEKRKERRLPYFLNASLQRSHFEGEHGHVQSLLLEEGTYYLAPRAGNDLYECLKSRPQYKFSVKSGEFVYLGSFVLTLGNELRHSASANRQRDTDYFLERNPAMSNVEVTMPPVEFSVDTRGEC